MLIVVQLGIASISLAYLFMDDKQNLIEYCNTFENKSMMDENEKEVDDIFKLVFNEDEEIIRKRFEMCFYSEPLPTNEHGDICTPPPEHS